MELNSTNYLIFINFLTKQFRVLFGRIAWDFSLLYEANPNKSDCLHAIFNKQKYKPERSVLFLLIRKFAVILYRIVLSYSYKELDIEKEYNYLSMTYEGTFLNDIERNADSILKIVMPQMKNYKERYNIAIDDFSKWYDFFFVFIKWLCSFPKNLVCIFLLNSKVKQISKSLFDYDCSKNLKADIYRSFIGDVFIEGLYYERLFKRLFQTIKFKKIVYPFEGQGWEKIMINSFLTLKGKDWLESEKTETVGSGDIVGISCSCPSFNLMNYFYPLFDSLASIPNCLCVLGQYSKLLFYGSFLDRIILFGNNRYDYLKDVVNHEYQKEKIVTVIYTTNDFQNVKLYQNTLSKFFATHKIIHKHHPDNENKNNAINLDSLLEKSEVVCCIDSSVAIEAFLYGCKVFICTDGLIDISPLPEKYRERRASVNERKLFFENYFSVFTNTQRAEILDKL